MLSHLARQIVLWVLIFLTIEGKAFELGVTYTLSGGRFGDSLLSYLHAKWISFEKRIPLYYVPFVYSSDLKLDQFELSYQRLRRPFSKILWGDACDPSERILYVCPYFPEDPWELKATKAYKNKPWRDFKVDWKNPEFRKILHEMIQPKYPLSTVIPPRDRISIAMHIREGGGFDINGPQNWPLKMPPLHFYIDSLNSVVEMCQGNPLYCYLFTDALDPASLVVQLQEALPLAADIQFDYRAYGNSPNKNVLEDFFSFFHFDILIRSQSNYSLIPSLIHDFAIVFSPEEFERTEKGISITKIKVEKNATLFK